MIPILTSCQACLVPVRRHGETLHLFLDTGCPQSFSSRGLVLGADDLGAPLAPFPVPAFPWASAVLEPLGAALGLEVHGLLGADLFFAAGVVQLDHRRQLARFGSMEEDRLRYTVPWEGSPLVVRVSWDGQQQLAFVDTGAMTSSAPLPLPGRAPSSGLPWVGPTPGGPVTVNLHRGVSARLAGVPAVPCTVATGAPAPIAILGEDLLGRFDSFALDFRQGALRLGAHLGPPPVDLLADWTLGIQVEVRAGRLVVSQVFPGHAHQGLRPGQVLEIPGLDLAAPGSLDEALRRVVFVASPEPVRLRVDGAEVTLVPRPLGDHP